MDDLWFQKSRRMDSGVASAAEQVFSGRKTVDGKMPGLLLKAGAKGAKGKIPRV